MKRNGTSEAEVDGETLKRLLTPNSVAVVERLTRDHGLGTEEIIRSAVDELLYCYEEDVATHGKVSGGENERALVRHAYKLANGRPRVWSFSDTPAHKIGSVSFFQVLRRNRIVRLKKTISPAAPSLRLLPAAIAA